VTDEELSAATRSALRAFTTAAWVWRRSPAWQTSGSYLQRSWALVPATELALFQLPEDAPVRAHREIAQPILGAWWPDPLSESVERLRDLVMHLPVMIEQAGGQTDPYRR
jgi:hypothetical protein